MGNRLSAVCCLVAFLESKVATDLYKNFTAEDRPSEAFEFSSGMESWLPMFCVCVKRHQTGSSGYGRGWRTRGVSSSKLKALGDHVSRKNTEGRPLLIVPGVLRAGFPLPRGTRM